MRNKGLKYECNCSNAYHAIRKASARDRDKKMARALPAQIFYFTCRQQTADVVKQMTPLPMHRIVSKCVLFLWFLLRNSSYTHQESQYDRPIAGHVNICPRSISTAPHDAEALLSTIKHEILHALGFNAGLYAFYRDDKGLPRTPR